MDIILWICVCMLALIGMSCIVGDLMYAKSPKKLSRCNYRVITLYDNPADVEQILNKCLLRLGWNGPDGAIILVDMGMGPEALEICKRAMNDMFGAFICTESELPPLLRKLDKMLADVGREACESES